MTYNISGITNIIGVAGIITTSDNIVGGVLMSSFIIFLFIAIVLIGMYNGLKIQQSVFGSSFIISILTLLLTWVGMIDFKLFLGFVIGTVAFAFWAYYDR